MGFCVIVPIRLTNVKRIRLITIEFEFEKARRDFRMYGTFT